MNSKVPAHSTVLGKADSLTEDERTRLAEEWANRSLDGLLEYAKDNRSFAISLCEKIVDALGPDDQLARVLRERFRKARAGIKKGRHPEKWTDTRYKRLLIHYIVLRNEKRLKRDEVLNMLADSEKLAAEGVNRAKAIEERITEARKRFSAEDLAHYISPPNLHK